MLKDLQRFISQHQLLEPSSRVLMAISGGADSVCLANMLIDGGWYVEFAHCNFRLRSEESDGDEHFVQQFAARKGVVCHCKSFDTELYASQQGISIEMAARDLRYAWFSEIIAKNDLHCVAVAHTQTDVVETFFINLVRGTGIRGLTGIKPRNQHIVRPLLFANRAQVEDYCQANNLLYRTDSSNLTNDYVRNKFRNTILPQIREINPSLDNSIASTIGRLAGVEALYQEAIDLHQSAIVKQQGETLFLSCQALRNCPQAATVLFEILHPHGFTTAQIDDVLLAVAAQPGKQFFSPQAVLTKDRTQFILTPLPAAPTSTQWQIRMGQNVCNLQQIHVEERAYETNFALPQSNNSCLIDANLVQLPLILRPWSTGDWMMPMGMNGKRKKVSDLLTDAKMPLPLKQQQCVLCTANGDIVWLLGIRADHRFRITQSTTKVLEVIINN